MHAFINSSSPWLNEYIESFIQAHVPDVVFVDDVGQLPKDGTTTFQLCDGTNLSSHFAVLNASDASLMNAYPNSDALARKDCLGRVVEYWTTKRPNSILKKHVPKTVTLSLDYSEYVDDALAAADDLTLLYSLEENAGKDAFEREWWILKASCLDCGDGIRIFSSMDELANFLELAADVEEEYEDEISVSVIGSNLEGVSIPTSLSVSVEEQTEADAGFTPNVKSARANQTCDKSNVFSPSLSDPYLSSLDALITATGKITVDDESGDEATKNRPPLEFDENARIMSARIREFVAQRYIISVPTVERKKWHARAYVLAMGRLRIFVFRGLLALLTAEDYQPPWRNPGLRSSLTNTSLQKEDEFMQNNSMRNMWDLPDDLLPGDWKSRIFDQICVISAEVFQAAVHTMADKFTPLGKCFELFALDFLVDTDGIAWLLEVNETPAFYQNGVAGEMAKQLMESVILVTMEHMGKARIGEAEDSVARDRMLQVLDETERLGKSNIIEILPEM